MIETSAADPRLATLPPEAALLLITGPAASGKTAALALRYVAMCERAALEPARTVVAAAHAAGARALAARIAAQLAPAERPGFAAAPFAGITLDALGHAIAADGALAAGLAPDLERLTADEIEDVFERAVAPLFSADWADFLGPDVDPEISGLRTPDRFAAAVLRLIGKLRDAGIGPDELLQLSLRGATTFYAKPPNLAEPGLLYATKDDDRPSLAVGPAELERQRRREIDLAKIVAKLYEAYVAESVRYGCLGPGDAVAEAVRVLAEQPGLARAYRERLRLAVVDDAQDLRGGDVRLLQALFGPTLRGVTFAGALSAATRTFAGARPEATFKLAATTVSLPETGALPAQLLGAAQLLQGEGDGRLGGGDALRLHRFADRAAEARFVGDAIAAHVAAGVAPERIAVVHRTARCLRAYEDALLERDVSIALHGDADLLNRPDVGDALAVLWSAVDPYRHAWLLRALQLPGVGLSDASLALLCGEPSNPQAQLFALPPEEPSGERRWDRRRDVRLGNNVVRGERDADLGSETRARLERFRARRAAWAELARAAGPAAAATLIDEAGLRGPREGETAARLRWRNAQFDALLGLVERRAARYPSAPLEDALVFFERVARAERGPELEAGEGVFVGAIDRIGPRRFAHVYVVDVRAGSFPPYYVADAFLFSPRYGMIPKDAAGDAPAARTAKFTWYAYQSRLKDAYAREHRRLLALALLRADETATVSAGGRATRGIGAPELVSELLAFATR